MTIEEAKFCMEEYQKDPSDYCIHCHFYQTQKCKAETAYRMAYRGLELLSTLSDKMEDLQKYGLFYGDEPKVELFDVIKVLDDGIDELEKIK